MTKSRLLQWKTNLSVWDPSCLNGGPKSSCRSRSITVICCIWNQFDIVIKFLYLYPWSLFFFYHSSTSKWVKRTLKITVDVPPNRMDTRVLAPRAMESLSMYVCIVISCSVLTSCQSTSKGSRYDKYADASLIAPGTEQGQGTHWHSVCFNSMLICYRSWRGTCF